MQGLKEVICSQEAALPCKAWATACLPPLQVRGLQRPPIQACLAHTGPPEIGLEGRAQSYQPENRLASCSGASRDSFLASPLLFTVLFSLKAPISPLRTWLMRSFGEWFNTFSPCNNGILEIFLRVQTDVKSVAESLTHRGSKSSCTRRDRGRVSHSWEVGVWAVRIQASGLRPLPAYRSHAISK